MADTAPGAPSPSRRARSAHRRRAVAGVLAVASLAVALAPAPSGAQAAAPPDPPAVTVDEDVRTAVDATGKADFWVYFAARADLEAAYGISDWTARGQYVVDALQRTADDSQARARDLLTAAGTTFTTYWAANAIRVEAGSAATLDAVVALPEVASIEATRTYPLPVPADFDPDASIQAVEWGIAEIGADDVWSTFGTRGEGIVVANIDSGVQFDHPALVDAYRGNSGGGGFDHDHNWFDPSAVCGNPSLAPCDNNGHGTHTMGTMVGDDGAGNQVGVAPGARWIAAKGCESTNCSDSALLASGQWVLAPTDLAGADPDPAQRPDIVNNSWGGDDGGDTWYAATVAAWRASGIFPVFSNGNAGPNCGTVGAPASYAGSYGVGNYTQAGTINASSSRGPSPVTGVGVKPDISAPGTNVRSSVPGNGYANFTGTSMASPHVSGVVALMWSAAPSLVGSVDATIALLDATARDTADAQCGGTAGDNNVYGQGKVDALAAVEASPRGPTGTVAGTVTDAATGARVAGAEVVVGDRTVVTAGDGTYSVTVETGMYTVTASAFGYATGTVTVTVTEGETVTGDLALVPLATTVVTGTVVDGGGQGWPLYARVAIDPYPGDAVFTDADTGAFSVALPDGGEYTLTVTAEIPGYRPAEVTVTLPGDADVAVALLPDDACGAPGYEFESGLFESFPSGTLPAGWTVTDQEGNGQVWRFDDPGERGNLTGGDDGFAIIDSDEYGSTGRQNTSLVTPTVDLSAVTDPVVRFNTDYNDLSTEQADVDVSIDGGVTWTNVWRQLVDLRGPRTVEVALPTAADRADVRLRFHYYVGTFDWWWQVDDVLIGSDANGVGCRPVPGGLVAGNVLDLITGAGINGATVTADTQPGVSAVTAGTPEDPAEPDGYYAVFSPATGPQSFTATAPGGYASDTRTVDVVLDGLAVLDFAVGAGALTVTPPSIETDVELGLTTFASVLIRNRGTETATFELAERDRGREILAAGAPVQRVAGTFSPTQATPAAAAAGAAPVPAPTQDAGPAAPPWTAIDDYPTRIMDSGAATVDGVVYVLGGYTGTASIGAVNAYDFTAGGWSAKAAMPTVRNRPMVGVIDGIIYAAGGWESSGASDNLEAYDPAANTWRTRASMPVPRGSGAGVVHDGLLYAIGGCDPAACTPLTAVHRYDPAANTWTAMAPYPRPVAWQSCAALDDEIVCAGGLTAGGTTTTATYRYDTSGNTWTEGTPLPQDAWAAGYTASNGRLLVSGGVTDGFATVTNEGFAYDPATNAWSSIPAANNVVYRAASACGFYKVGGSTGGFNPVVAAEQLPDTPCDAGAADVPWLALSPVSATLAPGESALITVTLDASVPEVDQPGTYGAEILVREDTPYQVPPVPVTLTVTPPASYGKLTGTLTGLARCDAEGGPLAGATVTVDGALVDYVLRTAADGTWEVWLDEADNPVTITFAQPGWVAETVVVPVEPGAVVTVDEALRLDAPCAGVAPEVLELSVATGGTISADLAVTNHGAAPFSYVISESPFTLSPQGQPERVFSEPAAIGPQSVRSVAGAGPGAKAAPGGRADLDAPPWFGGGDVPGGVARYGHAVCDGTPDAYYVVGGVTSAGAATGATYRYDAVTNGFTALTPMPLAGEAPMAVCEGGLVHVIGGSATDRHLVYNPITDAWTTAAPAPRPVWGAALGAWDGRLFLAGGDADFSAGGTQRRVDVYDIATDSWSAGPALPVAAGAVGYAQVQQYLYVVGGWGDASPGTNLAAGQRLDLATGEWTVGASLPAPRGDLALAATDAALYAIGGDTSGGTFFNPSRTVTRLVTATWPAGTWTTVDQLPAARTANSAGYCTEVVFGTEVWSVGGVELVGTAVSISGRTWLRAASDERCPAVRGDVPWLSVDPTDGTVAADSAVAGTVTVDAGGLAPGNYEATLFIATTDAAAPELRVPVSVEVTGGGLAPAWYVAGATSGPVGGVTVADEDLVAVAADGAVAMAFDGSDVGLAALALDAAAALDDGSWVFSFTEPGTVPGVAGTVDDSDLVRFVPTGLGDTTVGTFAMWLDASDIALSSAAEDVDAVDVRADGTVVLSTVGAFSAGTLTGHDRDLLLFTPTALGDDTDGTLTLLFDGDDVGLTTANEDVDAVATAPDGSLALSTLGPMGVPGLVAGGADMARFVPTLLGPVTTGTWDPTLVYAGAPAGFTQVGAFERA